MTPIEIQIRPETGIVHARVAETSRLREFLSRLEITGDIDRWVHMGCVYVNGVRVREDAALIPGQIVRLHTRPKSYVANIPNLRARVCFENEELLVVDKPAGLPTHPTLDNYLENAKQILEQQLQRKIYVTHRLDVGTRGLLLLAKNPKAQVRLNKLFARGAVGKTYLALVERAVPTGTHILFINPEGRVPRATSTEPREGWWECRLIVESCEPLASNFRLRLALLTGRTHQIRAQLAFLGSPILGDALYGSAVSWPEPGFALECHELRFRDLNHDFSVARATRLGDS